MEEQNQETGNSEQGTKQVWHEEPLALEPMSDVSGQVSGAPERLLEALGTVQIAPAKAATLRAVLRSIRESVDNALKLLDEGAPESMVSESLIQPSERGVPAMIPFSAQAHAMPGDRVLEGVFDGEQMVGDDGKGYAVPPNYASKSKLVEGDLMKLTIGPRGNFIYKQIGPIERQRVVGTLAYDQGTGHFMAVGAGRSWKVLKASITFFRGEAGDEIVILAPKNAPSKWAAVENVIKRNPLTHSHQPSAISRQEF